jgi:hypothetical protein
LVAGPEQQEAVMVAQLVEEVTEMIDECDQLDEVCVHGLAQMPAGMRLSNYHQSAALPACSHYNLDFKSSLPAESSPHQMPHRAAGITQ